MIHLKTKYCKFTYLMRSKHILVKKNIHILFFICLTSYYLIIKKTYIYIQPICIIRYQFELQN